MTAQSLPSKSNQKVLSRPLSPSRKYYIPNQILDLIHQNFLSSSRTFKKISSTAMAPENTYGKIDLKRKTNLG